MTNIDIHINIVPDKEFVVKTQQQTEIENKPVEKEINKQIIRKSLGPVPRPSAEVLQKQNNPKLKEEEEAWDQGIKDLQV